jgi:hypothetical protein
MAIAGKIFIVLGAGLLLLAGIFFLDAVIPSGDWGPHGAGFGLMLAQFPGVPGACALLLGIHLLRKARNLGESRRPWRETNVHFVGSSAMKPALPSRKRPSMFSSRDRRVSSQ